MIRKYERVSSANERPDNSAYAYGQHRGSLCATIIKYGGGQKSNVRRIASFLLARFLHRLPHPLVELSPIDATNSAVQLVHIEILFTVSSEMRCTASQLQRTVSSYPNRRRRGKRDARVVVAHIEMFVERRSKSGKAPSALHRGENRNTRCILSLRTVER